MATTPSDALVSARDVLRAAAEIRRRGQHEVMWELEKREPDLAEFLLEECSLLHRRLDEAGLDAKQVRRLDRRIERLCLVSLCALRQATLQLLRVNDCDPSAEEDATGSPESLGPEDQSKGGGGHE